MQAIVMREFGGPEVLRVEDIADPVADAGQIVVQVHAVSVNRTLDCVVRAGKYSYRPGLPHILGVDPAGIVVAVGKGVAGLQVGDRIVSSPIVGRGPTGAPQLLGVHRWGGYAERVAVPAANAHLIPDGVDFATACVVGRHFPLAFAQLRDHGRVQPGDWVLVMGAAGGLGSAAVQAACYLGAKVIAGAGSAARCETAVALGANVGIDYHKQDLAAEVRRITDGAGVAIVIENIGDPALFPQALAALARGGRLVTAGAHGGGIVPLNVPILYQNQLTIVGAPVERAIDYGTSLRAVAEGKMQVLIDQRMPLRLAAEAHAKVESGNTLGKIILEP